VLKPQAGPRLEPRGLRGRDIRVGLDVKTIRQAIKMAQPGDTIHLQPFVYHDYAGFYGKKGAAGRPITLDGHGATLEGSDPLDVAKWQEVSPGLFANDNLLRLDDAVIVRWFFLWDGKMNLMGRTSKGRKAPFKQPEALRPGEWTFVEDKSRRKPPSPQIFGTFYVKLPPGQKLADAHIAAPLRSAGVQIAADAQGGGAAHLVIKNITATHPYNDGFNIHGDCRDLVFQNIRALECGDDGISSHETAECRVDGFISMGNSTGIADAVAAHTSYNHVFIAGCHAIDLLFIMNGRYQVENAVVLSSSEHPLIVQARNGEHCELTLENVLVHRLGQPQRAEVQKDTVLRARRVTLENTDLVALGEATFENCLINGQPRPAGSPATGADKARLLKELVPTAELLQEFSAAPAAAPPAAAQSATLADVPYGPHPRQVLDFYRAAADKPTPVMFFIHGGGWTGGEKTGRTGPGVKPFLHAGISVVAINYRYVWQAQLAGVQPPVAWPMHDAARALQFVRSKAAPWNIDKQRIGACGGSAGACTALWLAFHDDLADAHSTDPVARESTRLWCAGVAGAQTSLDPVQLRQWIPNATYGGHAFGFMDPRNLAARDARFAEFLAARQSVLPWIKEYSPYEHVSADDPPVYLQYRSAPALGQKQADPTHSANAGLKLWEKCQAAGVACELVYPGAPGVKHQSVDDFLIEELKAAAKPAAKPARLKGLNRP